jgi:hypothetical protein
MNRSGKYMDDPYMDADGDGVCGSADNCRGEMLMESGMLVILNSKMGWLTEVYKFQ